MDRPTRLLFVCSGNICRSPMAEGLARAYGGELVEVRSAGTLQIFGRPADRHAVTVLAELGIDISAHRSQGLTPELMEWADVVLAKQLHHVRWAHDNLPDASKVELLGPYAGQQEIDDPVGGWVSDFRACRDVLVPCVKGLLDRL